MVNGVKIQPRQSKHFNSDEPPARKGSMIRHEGHGTQKELASRGFCWIPGPHKERIPKRQHQQELDKPDAALAGLLYGIAIVELVHIPDELVLVDYAEVVPQVELDGVEEVQGVVDGWQVADIRMLAGRDRAPLNGIEISVEQLRIAVVRFDVQFLCDHELQAGSERPGRSGSQPRCTVSIQSTTTQAAQDTEHTPVPFRLVVLLDNARRESKRTRPDRPRRVHQEGNLLWLGPQRIYISH